MLTKEMLKESETGIDKSEFYLALLTENFLKDEFTLYQWNYAKRKNKPFILAIRKDIKIPEDMLKDVNVVNKFYWENEEELSRKSKKLCKFLEK